MKITEVKGIEKYFNEPEKYVSEETDTVITTIVGIMNDLIMIMIGYDPEKCLYYFVVESDDESYDTYCFDNDLESLYTKILNKIKEAY